MNPGNSIAIIGSGPSALYLLKGIADGQSPLPSIAEIHIYEKDALMGMGMPYNPNNTDKYNLANITSEEIPVLCQSFADWLKQQSHETLADLDIDSYDISAKKVYSRIALGRYFYVQYTELIQKLKDSDILIFQYPGLAVNDIEDQPEENCVHLFLSDGSNMKFNSVFIATGHNWDDADEHENGYYKSPWPISKILPKPGLFYNLEIGLLGASLSAFDVVTSLAHRHGIFTTSGDEFTFKRNEEAPDFKIVMHSAQGWLPNLQYEQKEPLRKIYRYIDREGLMNLRDKNGFLRIETYFDKVCRPVLQEALFEDGNTSMAINLTGSHFVFEDFIKEMSARHSYKSPFEGMRKEMKKAKVSIQQDKPIYWKEAFDDLMYTLNFHTEYMPAEDHLFFHKEVMPFLMNVIAALPLQSAKILLALYDAGALDLVSGRVEEIKSREGKVSVTIEKDDKKSTTDYKLFIECGGDKKITLENYPFRSLVAGHTIRASRVAFAKSAGAADVSTEVSKDVFTEKGVAYYTLSGVDVDRSYQIVMADDLTNHRIVDLSFLHTAGLRPYSYGLQACHATSMLALQIMPETMKDNQHDSESILNKE